jgi:hypothetical protein
VAGAQGPNTSTSLDSVLYVSTARGIQINAVWLELFTGTPFTLLGWKCGTDSVYLRLILRLYNAISLVLEFFEEHPLSASDLTAPEPQHSLSVRLTVGASSISLRL